MSNDRPSTDIDWNSIALRLSDPATSEQTGKQLLRFVWSVVLTLPSTKVLMQMPSRLDLSDIVATAIKSIIKSIGKYSDDEGDEIRAKLIRLVHNKAVDKIKYNLCKRRDVRCEVPNDVLATVSTDDRLLLKSPPKRDKKNGQVIDKPLPPLLSALQGVSVEDAVKTIQNCFDLQATERLAEESEQLPPSLRLVFWLTLAGLTGDEIKETLRSMGEVNVTRGRVIHRQRLIRECLGRRT